ncbi:MAG: alpha/beta hydrolase [Zavarzinia sp.]|nr:alpha/beta hydrolase [Zavarzinia sp.]
MLMRYVDAGGIATRCLTAGDPGKPAVLLLHGLTLTADVWSRNIDALAADFHVVAPDLLGHGFTRAPGDAPPGIADKIGHLLALADALGLDRFALDGSSYGALIAANLCLRAPGRVSRLVITGSGTCFNSEADLAIFMARLWDNYHPRLTAMSPAEWREKLAVTVHDLASVPAELPWLLALCYALPSMRAAWERSIGDLRTPAIFRPFRILERLEELTVETLVVWGRQDRGGKLESALAATARMPNARLIAYDDCAHVPMLEQPDAYNRDVRAFLLDGIAALGEPAR